jgi:hypothetical protein
MAIPSPTSAETPGSFRLGLILVALLGILALQLPWIARPPFDAHSFRQAQTLSTIELFALEGIDIAHPKANYVGEPGVFVLELPLFQAFCALLYKWWGSHVWLVRLVNLLFTFGNAALTCAIARRLFNREAGFAAMLIYLFAPLNLLYMTSTLIDPSAAFCSLAAFLVALRIILHPNETDGRAGMGSWAAFALACVITALIKTLYLFPTCMLLAATFLARRRLSARLLAAGLCMAAAVGFFSLWLRHSQHVNDASYFTRGVSPTTLIGFEALTSASYYREIARRVLVHLAGPVGTVLATIGVIAALTGRTAPASAVRFPVVLLSASVFVYFFAFPKANQHDYYALVMSPYACIVAGFGATEVSRRLFRGRIGWLAPFVQPAAVAIMAAVLSTAMFLKKARLAPDPAVYELQQLSEGRFERWSFGMVFVAPDPRFPIPGNIGSDVPGALYATGLRGTGRLVADGASALAVWNEQRPHYQHLKYVVFHGLNPPLEIVRACRETIVADDARKWFAYRVE